MSAFVLVHGAMHGAWCWERLIPALRAAGHRVSAVDLPGSDGRIPPADVTLKSWTECVVAALADAGQPAFLVGHSMGGIPISTAAEARPDLIQALVYLCAGVPTPGKSSVEGSANAAVAAHFVSTDGGLSVSFNPAKARDFFYFDCPAEDAKTAMARLTPQPTPPLREPIMLTPERYGRVARHYILTTEDRAIDPKIQQELIDGMPGFHVHKMNAGHSPFYSQPGELADLMSKIAQGGAP